MIGGVRRWYRVRRYRRWHRGGFGNDPMVGTTARFLPDHERELAAPRPEIPGRDGVAVVDGTGFEVGEAVCAALRSDGRDARLVDAFELGPSIRGLILLLP